MRISTELVKTLDVEPFQAGEGDSFRFRLEIIRHLDSGTHMGKVYRLETYRLQPTYPQTEGALPDWGHDALIYVIDDMFNADTLVGASVQEVVEKFEDILHSLFHLTHDPE